MMARQPIDVPCPFVNILECVAPPFLRFFYLSFMLLHLAENSRATMKQLRNSFTGDR
jgi:hypothetical protein